MENLWFPDIPGYSNKYLIRVDNTDGLGLIRAIQLSRLFANRKTHTAFSYAKNDPKRHMKIATDFLVHLPSVAKSLKATFDDLASIQEAFNVLKPNTFGILVFDPKLNPPVEKSDAYVIEPVFFGNPQAEFQVPVLQYKINGQYEYCGIRNVGRLFGRIRYCVNCKEACQKRCSCELGHFLELMNIRPDDESNRQKAVEIDCRPNYI